MGIELDVIDMSLSGGTPVPGAGGGDPGTETERPSPAPPRPACPACEPSGAAVRRESESCRRSSGRAFGCSWSCVGGRKERDASRQQEWKGAKW